MFFISEVFILDEYFIIQRVGVCFKLEAFVLIEQKISLKIASTKKYIPLFHATTNY